MKKLIPAYILSFVITFMLYIVEPISMFVSNRVDFNFNFSNFIKPMLNIFFILFILLSLFYTLVYFINKKFSKKLTFYNVILVISFILFILLYIQGNFLISNLPIISGDKFDNTNYLIDNIITILLFYVITITYIVCCIKYKFDKVINVSKYITMAIFAMLFVGFIPYLFSSDLYDNKKIVFVSNKNINNISNDKNFFILVLDAVDSGTFREVINEVEYKDLFNDFTYYPDTLAMYPFTRDAIPHLLSGVINYNEQDFADYYNDAMDSSLLINKLSELKYDINIYEQDIKWNSKKSNVVSNLNNYTRSFSNECYIRQETKYILYKYLPYFMKQFSKAEYFDINSCKIDYNDDAFSVYNLRYNDTITNNDLNEVSNKYFSFVHIEGAHSPFDVDEELNNIKEGTYLQKVKASLKITSTFLERIKKSEMYDNSVIIVMADHGFGDDEHWQNRINPILLIKGLDEHHDMITSDKAISYVDLMDAYLDLLDNKKSTELFLDISNDRERKTIWYSYDEEDHMEEMVASGKAWDFESMKKTGVEFNR